MGKSIQLYNLYRDQKDAQQTHRSGMFKLTDATTQYINQNLVMSEEPHLGVCQLKSHLRQSLASQKLPVNNL